MYHEVIDDPLLRPTSSAVRCVAEGVHTYHTATELMLTHERWAGCETAAATRVLLLCPGIPHYGILTTRDRRAYTHMCHIPDPRALSMGHGLRRVARLPSTPLSKESASL